MPVVACATFGWGAVPPHNSCTAGEIGWGRSPAWNSVRNIGSCCGRDAVFISVPAVALTGVTARASGMIERKLALSIAAGDAVDVTDVACGAVAAANAIVFGAPPSAA